MSTQLKLLFPPRLCSKRTLITTSSISHEPIQPNNKSQVSVCVQSNFLLLLRKRYFKETSSNLNTKPTEKSPFFISYKRDGNHFDHLTIKHFWGTTKFLLIFGDNTFTWEVRQGSSCPPKSMVPPIYVFVLTPF